MMIKVPYAALAGAAMVQLDAFDAAPRGNVSLVAPQAAAHAVGAGVFLDVLHLGEWMVDRVGAVAGSVRVRDEFLLHLVGHGKARPLAAAHDARVAKHEIRQADERDGRLEIRRG